jgi:F-type H+-transporting ATPase subunit b
MANFFILVFILYRFLFKPVQNILKKREVQTTKAMDEAKQAQEEAEKAKKQFEEKTNNFEAEVTARTNEARIVIERTRHQMLKEMQTKIEDLKAQTEETLSQMQNKAIQQHKEKLGDLASTFSKGILQNIMNPSLEEAFKEDFFDRILNLDLSTYVSKDMSTGNPNVRLILPVDLKNDEKESLKSKLDQNIGKPINLSFEVDPDLIAGGILRFENELIDGSIKGQIAKFKTQYQEMV